MTEQTTAGAEAPASEAVQPKAVQMTAIAEEFKLLSDHFFQRTLLRASQVDELLATQTKLTNGIEEQAATIAELRAKKPKE